MASPRLLQNLRDFTVQIRSLATGRIVGTGIIVSEDGKLLTCAHVVLAAGVNPRQGTTIPSTWSLVLGSMFKGASPADTTGGRVGVYFPQLRGELRQASVAAFGGEFEDDLALLQLDGPSPIGPEMVAVLGTAEESEGNPFRSYGYRRLGTYPAGHAAGTIAGSVELPEGTFLQAEPIQLTSSQVNEGMSGAAVLDTDRNLVIGLIAETWFPDATTKDRDTAWAVSAAVALSPPFLLPMRREPLPLRQQAAPAISPSDQATAHSAMSEVLGTAWHAAPEMPDDWIERRPLLDALQAGWHSPTCRTLVLLGLGGEGKSSLARRWAGDLLSELSLQVAGLFWWTFAGGDVDLFFEAALLFLTGGRLTLNSTIGRRKMVDALLSEAADRRIVFVLDGLEAVQHRGGDRYGFLAHPELAGFLQAFGPERRTFCLMTSRAPVTDLMADLSHTTLPVGGLTVDEGRALLQSRGLNATDATADEAVRAWGGHALALNVMATLARDRFGGDVTAMPGLVPADQATLPERLDVLLGSFDADLSPSEKALLAQLSLLRRPVSGHNFSSLLTSLPPGDENGKPTSQDAERLVVRGLLQANQGEASDRRFSVHPLVRNLQVARLRQRHPEMLKQLHKRFAYFFFTVQPPWPGALQNLVPPPSFTLPLLAFTGWIEATHHICGAEEYDMAFQFLRQKVDGPSNMLMYRLGAYGTMLAIIREFFPELNTSKQPLLSDSAERNFLMTRVGVCFLQLGNLAAATEAFKASVALATEREDWHNASAIHRNITSVQLLRGDLAAAAAAAAEALLESEKANDPFDRSNSLGWAAWLAHLRGNMSTADKQFEAARVLEYGATGIATLTNAKGLQHATHLARTGQIGEARQVVTFNLSVRDQLLAENVPLLLSLDAELGAAAGRADTAAQFDAAVRLAQDQGTVHGLIEVLTARGLWIAEHGGTGGDDLAEAFRLAISGEYRLLVVDVRLARARACIVSQDPAGAYSEAQTAEALSKEMGYHWGLHQAGQLLALLLLRGTPAY